MGDAIGFRQQLSMTSFEAFELEIAVNYPIHTWVKTASFTWNLTSWSVPFWLVFLTEHKVLHCYAPNMVYHCLVAGQLYPFWRFFFSRLSMLPSFQPLLRNSLNSLRAPHPFDRWIFDQNCIFVWNFHDFVWFLVIFRSRQFSKVHRIGEVGK